VTVVVEHRDRLGPMNTELVDAALSAHGRRLVALDSGEVTEDLVRDMLEVLTFFVPGCIRRSARNRAIKALRCAQRDLGPAVFVGAGGQDVGHGGTASVASDR
jgi:putative resolvase